MGLFESELKNAIKAGLKNESLEAELMQFNGVALSAKSDVKAIGKALTQVTRRKDPRGYITGDSTKVRLLTSLCLKSKDEKIISHIQEDVMPVLGWWFNKYCDQPMIQIEDFMMILRAFGATQFYAGIERIPDLARDNHYENHPDWSLVFETFTVRHPYTEYLIRTFRKRLPKLAARKALLITSNDFINANSGETHPFNSEDGRVALKEMIEGDDPEAAVEAAAALQHLDDCYRFKLLPLVEAHSDAEVRTAAA